MNEYYRQGFIDKCAELGVDPERLWKLAQGLSGPAQIKAPVQKAPAQAIPASTPARKPSVSADCPTVLPTK